MVIGILGCLTARKDASKCFAIVFGTLAFIIAVAFIGIGLFMVGLSNPKTSSIFGDLKNKVCAKGEVLQQEYLQAVDK